jgi:hypothetical protein
MGIEMKSGLQLERGARVRAELEVLDVERRGHVFGLWKNVVVAVWAATANAERVARFAAVASKAGERFSGLRSNVHVVVESAGLPGDEARAASSGLMNARQKQVACVALVVQGTGFWSGAIRGAMTHVHMQANTAVPLRMFGSMDEAARWLPGEHERRCGVALSPDDLRVVLESAVREV